MKYPTEKAKVLVLAHTVNSGLKKNTTVLPSPPVTTTAMDADLDAYEAKREEITEAEAVVKNLYAEEEEIYDRINGGTPQNLRYVESVANGREEILALVGWGNPRPRQPLQPPGQPRALEIVGQGDGWVQIDWKEPKGDGGAVASYVVRRSEDGGDFVDAKTETASDSILLNQPKGKKLIYQVVAINRAGESLASNTITIIL